jgi:hypothetical protein
MAKAEVTGVITALGVFVFHSRDVGPMLGFHLKPWRFNEGNLNFTELRVTKPMSESDIAEVKKRIDALSVVSVMISDLEDYYEDRRKTVLDKILNPSVDNAEFNEIVHRLRQPIEFFHPLLGRFLLDRRVDTFEGEYEFEGNKFAICLDSHNDAPIAEQLVILESILADIKNYNTKAMSFAAEKLLPIKNDSWVEEPSDVVTESEFVGRMKLSSVSVTLEKQITFFYDDGDLFYGHSIFISGVFGVGFDDARF